MAIDTRLIKTTEKTYYEKFGELPPAIETGERVSYG